MKQIVRLWGQSPWQKPWGNEMRAIGEARAFVLWDPMVYSKQEDKEMKKLMIMAVACLMAAMTFAADADADALKAVLEKVADAETQCRIGNCYAEGKVVAKDAAEAAAWYRKAAEQGHVVARHELGVLYLRGIHVATNYAEAVRLFRKGAESGYARSIHNLGTCYAEGLGVPQDKAEAYRLYRKAAEMGLGDSQFNVGTCYDMGWGVERNRQEALKWYRKAAAQGNKLAGDKVRELMKKKSGNERGRL